MITLYLQFPDNLNSRLHHTDEWSELTEVVTEFWNRWKRRDISRAKGGPEHLAKSIQVYK